MNSPKVLSCCTLPENSQLTYDHKTSKEEGWMDGWMKNDFAELQTLTTLIETLDF